MGKINLYQVYDSYYLKFEYPTTIKVDDKIYKDVTEVYLLHKPQEIKILKTISKVASYGNLTPEQYEEEINKLIKLRDEDGDPIFDNLDDEYKYKKFIQEHPPKYVKETIEIDTEIIEHNITGKTDIPYIKPLRVLKDKIPEDDLILYRYTPNPYQMAKEIAKELGLEEVNDNLHDQYQKNLKRFYGACLTILKIHCVF
jgi:hypothetical protein